ncbi:cobalamin biosynthesis protein CobD [Oxalicibacterium flavum]|uniref:Cobalamin biosynthesis protein CobD n=1 Tax=Oxalicibacterium flavum TaxID=179467 RepID=A0A8J2XYE6_9BURK|nr:adenosylcobinamide-phosphate synthase CbiB [Oxalicibacterium flavum]GGC10819.1 cobalamin biosynthesis protein CobD [Oxalicibacterium flavum]
MLAGLTFDMVALLVWLGLALDRLLGEPRRWHPLAGFGNVAALIERRMNDKDAGRLRGMLAWLLAVLPLVAASWFAIAMLAQLHFFLALAAHVLMLYFGLGLRSLRDHIMPIAAALQAGDLPLARSLTSRIVSRDTAQLPEADLAKAGVESLLENGNDAVFATLFWFVIAGGPGAVLFRLANTLDAMWGYRTARFLHFGWAAARIDDLLNLAPARLTALSYAALGNTRLAWQCWRAQAPQWSSPNAGPVMAAGAGALAISLGGAAVYDGELEQRPTLGSGPRATGKDIARAWKLVAGTAWLWMGVIGIAGVCLA